MLNTRIAPQKSYSTAILNKDRTRIVGYDTEQLWESNGFVLFIKKKHQSRFSTVSIEHNGDSYGILLVASVSIREGKEVFDSILLSCSPDYFEGRLIDSCTVRDMSKRIDQAAQAMEEFSSILRGYFPAPIRDKASV